MPQANKSLKRRRTALLLDPAQFTMDQALEWTKLERECCPFLEMQVRWDIENGPVWLDLKGPEGRQGLRPR
jgi:hypothetical protein